MIIERFKIYQMNDIYTKDEELMEINDKIQTPFFLVDKNILDNLLSDLKKALYSFYPNAIIGYSFKTNNLPWIITYMKKNNLYAEVVSSDEYTLAKELEYETKNIIFNGPAKNKEEFIDAVNNGAIVNIDSHRELQWLLHCDKSQIKKSKIGLRVNFCLEDYCPGESQCGNEDGRFGFSYETGDLKYAIDFLEKNSIPLSGLHLHCSSKSRSLNIYRAIAKISVDIVREYKLNLSYLDIGGGYFGGVEGKPSFFDYFSNIYKILNSEKLLRDVNLIIEPGMSLIGASMKYVTRVIDIKKTKNNDFVLLDGSRIHIDPLMRKKSYSYQIERKSSNLNIDTKEHQILCGFTCMEGDRFFHYNGQKLSEGDYVIFEKVGAYTIGLSPQFIEFHPDIYVLDEDLKLVQSKRTAKEFIKDKKSF